MPSQSSQYPEHDKVVAIQEKSQACGEFFEWLQQEKDIHLAKYHEHTDECYIDLEEHEDYKRHCGMCEGVLYPTNPNLLELLYEFFGIDRKKFEQEKEDMLAEMRKTQ
jgi:hypothetical protein